MCKVCGASASHKMVKLCQPCTRPTAHGKYNIKAYANGKPPRGFPGWPYKEVHLMDNVVVSHVQKQLNAIQKTYMAQHQYPESDSDSDQYIQDDILTEPAEICMICSDSGCSSD